MLQKLKNTMKQRFPRQWVAYADFKSPKEPELALLSRIVPPNLTSVDVGANMGVYTRRLAKLTPRVHAFEPTEEMALLLKQTSAKNVVIHQMALSDRAGTADLHVPVSGGKRLLTRASLKAMGGVTNKVAVSVRRLDEEISEQVGFIKIDVEGHELAVIRGAEAIINQHRPIFLVECEERHNSGGIEKLKEFFAARRYSGKFLNEGRLVEINQFILSVHQHAEGVGYVNNFFFFPET